MQRISVLLAGLLVATAARGQATQQQPATTGTDRLAPIDQSDTAQDRIGESYRTNGGSLMQAQVGRADALRRRAAHELTSLYAVPTPEPRVIRKHDLITVIVREQSEFSSEGSSDMQKNAQLQAALNEFIRVNLGNLELEPAIGGVKPTVNLTGRRQWAGDGKIDRKDEFTTRIQAEVIDVKPNGNLVIAARKRIQTDDEIQVFLISGIVRAADITLDNTVLSTQMFDLDLTKQNEGTIREATRRGWLSRWVDQITPF